MNYSFRKLIVINSMIVQRPEKIHPASMPAALPAAITIHFQLQLGMKFSPVWVS